MPRCSPSRGAWPRQGQWAGSLVFVAPAPLPYTRYTHWLNLSPRQHVALLAISKAPCAPRIGARPCKPRHNPTTAWCCSWLSSSTLAVRRGRCAQYLVSMRLVCCVERCPRRRRRSARCRRHWPCWPTPASHSPRGRDSQSNRPPSCCSLSPSSAKGARKYGLAGRAAGVGIVCGARPGCVKQRTSARPCRRALTPPTPCGTQPPVMWDSRGWPGMLRAIPEARHHAGAVACAG